MEKSKLLEMQNEDGNEENGQDNEFEHKQENITTNLN